MFVLLNFEFHLLFESSFFLKKIGKVTSNNDLRAGMYFWPLYQLSLFSVKSRQNASSFYSCSCCAIVSVGRKTAIVLRSFERNGQLCPSDR